jgi:hypothetical protein
MQVDGLWNVFVKTPMGPQKGVLDLRSEGAQVFGKLTNGLGEMVLENGRIEGTRLIFSLKMTKPIRMTFEHDVIVEGDRMTGTVKAGFLGTAPFNGQRASSPEG